VNLVRMGSLTIMAPTKTNRRHFFLLEGGSDIRNLVMGALTLIGFHMSSVDDDQLDNEDAQISRAESSQNQGRHFLGGAISPAARIIERHRRYVHIFRTIGTKKETRCFVLELGIYSTVMRRLHEQPIAGPTNAKVLSLYQKQQMYLVGPVSEERVFCRYSRG
jgi:hypothetical protein